MLTVKRFWFLYSTECINSFMSILRLVCGLIPYFKTVKFRDTSSKSKKDLPPLERKFFWVIHVYV